MPILLLAVLAVIVQIAGYTLYTRNTLKARVQPSITGVAVWAITTVLGWLSYISLTDDDFKSILPITCIGIAIVFLFISTIHGKFQKLKKFEVLLLIADILIIIFWFTTQAIVYVNILFLLASVITFIPLILSVYKSPTYEQALPWFLWTTAYGLQIFIVFGRFEKSEDFMQPIIFFIIHFIVALLAIDRLREFNKERTEFLSFASHQLRAPLTAMKGYASLILEGDYGKSSPEMREAIGHIYRQATTLTNIVDDYLDITRIELGKMKYEFAPIDIVKLLNEVIAEVEPLINDQGLAIVKTVPEELIIYGDERKLKQVLMNLIENAIKYTKEGQITIILGESPKAIHFEVSDSGIGIPKTSLPLIFNKWKRASNANERDANGAGLGLFIAKEVIEAHGGRIWAESEGEDKGAVFAFEIPKMHKKK